MAFARSPVRRRNDPNPAWVFAVALLLLSAPVRAAGPQPWDQEKVTQIARELGEAVAEVRDAFRKEPSADLGSLQMNARYRLEEKLRLLDSETQALQGRLAAGEGIDATLPIYDRIGSLARDAREEARKQAVAKPVQERVDHAEATWSRLTPYYTKQNAPNGDEPDRERH